MYINEVRIIKILSFCMIPILTYISLSLLIRSLLHTPNYIWLPSINRLISNLSRPRAWLSFILALGVPGTVCIISSMLLYRKKNDFKSLMYKISPLLVGIISSVGVWVFAMITAYADGRFIWISYPFLIPVAMILLDHLNLNKQKIKQYDISNH